MCGVLGLKISERALRGVTKFGGVEFLGVELLLCGISRGKVKNLAKNSREFFKKVATSSRYGFFLEYLASPTMFLAVGNGIKCNVVSY